jgi:hypothetical protein
VQIPCSQGGKPKKFTLQGANQMKKKLQGGKTKLVHITEEYQPIYPKLKYGKGRR